MAPETDGGQFLGMAAPPPPAQPPLVVLINWITIRNSRLLENFVTIGIGKFKGLNISLSKSSNSNTLYVLVTESNNHNKFSNYVRVLQFCNFYCLFVIIGIGLKYWPSGM